MDDRLARHFKWSRVRMSFNIREKNFILLNKIPISTIKVTE